MRKWTDPEVEQDLRNIAHSLGHFPSSRELRSLGCNSLAIQVSRRGGFIHWSDRLGVPRQYSDSDTGWEGESAAAQRLTELGFQVEMRLAVKSPFDLLVDRVLRVDVKAARFARYGVCTGWFYRLGKCPQADLILLWQLDTGDFYALPWPLCPDTNVTISRSGGKYAAYRNNVEIIRNMVVVRQAELERLRQIATRN